MTNLLAFAILCLLIVSSAIEKHARLYLRGEPAQGQNNSDPFSVFRNHAVVKLTSSENYYDPSYGTPKFKTLKEWENRSLAGTGVMFGENSNRAWERKIMSPKSTTFFFVWFGPVNNPNEEDCIWKIFK